MEGDSRTIQNHARFTGEPCKQAVGNRQSAFGNSAFRVITDLSLTFSHVR